VISWAIVVWSSFTLVNDVIDRRWAHAAFAGSNALLCLYATLASTDCAAR
jgi:hypothetical protein